MSFAPLSYLICGHYTRFFGFVKIFSQKNESASPFVDARHKLSREGSGMAYYFTFRSITGAQRAMRALEQAGLQATLLRSPKFLSMKGCGYALKIRPEYGAGAAAAFRACRIRTEAVYRADARGGSEAVAL